MLVCTCCLEAALTLTGFYTLWPHTTDTSTRHLSNRRFGPHCTKDLQPTTHGTHSEVSRAKALPTVSPHPRSSKASKTPAL